MITSIKELSYEGFLEQYPQEGYYELVNGVMVDMRATREHDTIAEFLADTFKEEVKRSGYNYWVSGRIVVATPTSAGKFNARIPDVSVVDKGLWLAQPKTYAAIKEPIELAVEIVSTNWEDDYIDKQEEYEAAGIKEYWIVDFLAIASRSFLGIPKRPTVFVYTLQNNGKYSCQLFHDNNPIVSEVFPQLEINPLKIFSAIYS